MAADLCAAWNVGTSLVVLNKEARGPMQQVEADCDGYVHENRDATPCSTQPASILSHACPAVADAHLMAAASDHN